MWFTGILLAAALAANWRDWRMLALTATVGASVYMPVSGPAFYPLCILCEIVVGITAALLCAGRASTAVWSACILLTLCHLLGWLFNGWLPGSPYRLLVPLLEYEEIAACLIFSKPSANAFGHVAQFLGYNTRIFLQAHRSASDGQN